MCERGLRCAALAYQPYELEKLPSNEALSRLPSLPGKLVLLAIIGIEVTFPAPILKLKFVSMRIGT